MKKAVSILGLIFLAALPLACVKKKSPPAHPIGVQPTATPSPTLQPTWVPVPFATPTGTRTPGPDLVSEVRNFYIENRVFTNQHEITDGCVTAGNHRLLRFDMAVINIGDQDLVLGSPASNPAVFTYFPSHGHYHATDFNQYYLYDSVGNTMTAGTKQSFCIRDTERRLAASPPFPGFANCNTNQGLSTGWADVYVGSLPCQYVVIDTLPDGDYSLYVRCNDPNYPGESDTTNNKLWTGVRITGGTVTVIPPPFVIP